MDQIQTPVVELMKQFTATPVRLSHAVANKTPEQLRRRPTPDVWSAGEILAHMRAVDDIFTSRIYMLLTRDMPPLTAFDERRWAIIARYAQVPFQQSLALFTLRRAEFATVLSHLPTAAWQRCGQHEVHGVQSLLMLVQDIVAHESEHCTQLEALWAC